MIKNILNIVLKNHTIIKTALFKIQNYKKI